MVIVEESEKVIFYWSYEKNFRHPAVLYPKKMAQVSEVETMDLHLVDPATYEGNIIENSHKKIPNNF